MFVIITPNDHNRTQFKRFVPPQFHQMLESDPALTGSIILGAEVAGRIAGVLIARPHSEADGRCKIVFFWLCRSDHEEVMAKALLSECQQAAHLRGQRKLEITPHFPLKNEHAPTFFRLLNELHWDDIRLLYTTFYIHDQSIAHEHWFQLQLPDGYELFYWRTLRPQEKAVLQFRQDEFTHQRYPYLDPFVIDAFEEQTSLGVRQQATGHIMGWMINTMSSPGVLCFRRLFIIPEARSKGLFYPLLANSINAYFRHYQSATFNVAAENTTMRSVVLKMMGHLCDTVLETYSCSVKV